MSPFTDMAIETRGLSRTFGRTHAVRDLGLSVPRGALFGLIGPNGAGKTTTLRMLAGLLRPSAGQIDLLGEPISVRSGQYGVHRKVGYMPDFFGVYEDMLAWEYLDFFGRCHGLSAERRAKVVRDLLGLVDLGSKRDEQVDHLSRGMKQRLCLAQSLVHDPEILLLDEPASGLDPRARLEMRALLRELSAMGKTIVISSHILSELSEMCDGVAIMEHGELLEHGTVEDLNRRRRPRAMWRLTVASDPAAAVVLLEAAGVEVVSPSEEGAAWGDDGVVDEVASLMLAFEGDARARAAVVTQLVQAGVAVADLRPVEGDLEDLFMEITRGEQEA
jgi:ABC-2 type transport system ATP-binding protein